MSVEAKTILIHKRKTVAEFLAEQEITLDYFAVLVEGQAVEATHILNEGDKVVIVPKIKGG